MFCLKLRYNSSTIEFTSLKCVGNNFGADFVGLGGLCWCFKGQEVLSMGSLCTYKPVKET